MIINKNKCVEITCDRLRGEGDVSSIVNEGIRAILNLFIYLFILQEDISHKKKSTKRIQANKNKKDNIFMRIKNI